MPVLRLLSLLKRVKEEPGLAGAVESIEKSEVILLVPSVKIIL
jgi:hypothetical protein